MAGRPGVKGLRAASKAGRTDADVQADSPSRVDRLVELVDHCTRAQAAADEMGEKFLSYLLSMAIQESRVAIKRESASPQS